MDAVMIGVERRTRWGRRFDLVHAVPAQDRTRSALCGSSVRRTPTAWDDTAPGTCPECRALLSSVR